MTELGPRTHWEVTGPVVLAAASVLGLIVMGLIYYLWQKSTAENESQK